MTDPTETPAAPKPEKKKRKPGRPRAAARPVEKAPDELEGLTATDCCDGCKIDRCVITRAGICAHPLKGGLQSAFQTNPDIVKRFGRAKHFLRKAKLSLGEG